MADNKLSKVEREYNEIRNNKSLTARERINALLAIDTEKRPGAENVRKLQSALRSKVRAIKSRVDAKPTYNSIEYFAAVQGVAAKQFYSSIPTSAESYWNFRSARVAKRTRKLERLGDRWAREISEAIAFDADRRAGSPKRLLGNNYATDLKSISDLGVSVHQFARVGEWVIGLREVESVDWNAYSKAWHRAHGPKRTVESRTVLIRRFVGGEVEKRDVQVDSWRGNFALNALIQAGVVVSQKVATKLRPVQLHEAFAVREIRKIAGVTLYARTLAGEHYDYCALWHGLTFHAESPRACVAGLRAKIAEVERKKNATIDFKFCRTLGFCEEGIKQFARDFNLDIKGSYTAEEIADAVKGDLRAASTFAAELKKLADVVGYQIPAQFAL